MAYEFTKPCKIDLPANVEFQEETWMTYIGDENIRFRAVYLNRLLAAGLETEILFGQNLVSLRKPQLNIRLGETDEVMDVAYPFTAEQDQIVNVLTLTQSALIKIDNALSAGGDLVQKRGDTAIYSVVLELSPGATAPRSRLAYLAVNGRSLVYVEGGAFALGTLTRTLDMHENRDGLLFDSPRIREAYHLATKDLPQPIAVLGFSELENQAKVTYSLKALGDQSGKLRVTKVLSFASPDDMTTNLDSARELFLDSKDSTCQAQSHLVASSVRPLNELRVQLQSL